MPTEPSIHQFNLDRRSERIKRAVAATRPAFLSASLIPVTVAFSLMQKQTGEWPIALYFAVLFCVGLIHAGANTINDYFDHKNGTDLHNLDRIYPFTGGSRMIQNNVISPQEMRSLSLLLLSSGVVLGLLIGLLIEPNVLWFGLIGLVLAYFYSAPPCLVCKGLGDFVIAACFGLLPMLGIFTLLQGHDWQAMLHQAIVMGLLTAAILWVNSIPDIKADINAGKHTLVARLGSRHAQWALILLTTFSTFYALLLTSFAWILVLPLSLIYWGFFRKTIKLSIIGVLLLHALGGFSLITENLV